LEVGQIERNGSPELCADIFKRNSGNVRKVKSSQCSGRRLRLGGVPDPGEVGGKIDAVARRFDHVRLKFTWSANSERRPAEITFAMPDVMGRSTRPRSQGPSNPWKAESAFPDNAGPAVVGSSFPIFRYAKSSHSISRKGHSV